MEKVDELSLDLRPAMLDDLGLLPALLWHFERYTAQTRVYVNLEHSGMERRFSAELETALYRVVQEALTNVASKLIPPRPKKPEPRFLSEDEYQRLLRAGSHNPRDAAVIEVLLQTGMRLSELAPSRLAPSRSA